MYKSFDPTELEANVRHDYLLSTIAPRPIAWASTVDRNGNVNLAPFSFFNVFGSNPPILVFSPSSRVRDNTHKHTLLNAQETMECVINIVSYEMAGQMSLTSGEFQEGVNEFEMANLEMLPSLKVKAPRVKNAPAQFECRIRDIIQTGTNAGAGHLIICEVIHIHLNESIFNGEGKIDPHLVDNVARMGKIWYTRAKEGLFQMPNPKGKNIIGFGRLPDHIRNSRFLTGSELGKLAGVDYEPTPEEIKMVEESTGMKEIFAQYGSAPEMLESKLHNIAKTLIAENKFEEAWRVLLSFR
jgi:flavin reductase (DIM6/NTAB) family NADH-FMN oxidoreductase RutF